MRLPICFNNQVSLPSKNEKIVIYNQKSRLSEINSYGRKFREKNQQILELLINTQSSP